MRRHLYAPILAVLLLGGCSRGGAASGDQVVAVVDGEELTTPVLEAALSALPPDVDNKDPAIQRTVVRHLIDEMLLSDAARNQGLEKTPQVARELARAERMVLSDAYLRRTNGHASPPTDQDVVSFFGANPAMFAERRRYRLRQLTLTGSPQDVAPYVQIVARAGGSIQALGEVLAARRIASLPEETIANADSFGPTLATRLAALKPGDTFNFRSGNTQTFAEVLAVDPSPVPLALAQPVIRRLLARQTEQASIKATVDRLRSTGTIEYGKVGKSIMAPARAKPTATANRGSRA